MGLGRGPPRLSRPSGRAERSAGRDPEAEGARRHLHRPASAQRARRPPRALGPSRGPRGAGERGQGRPGPLGARGAAATARLGWNAPPPASWKPLLALGRPPGAVPRAGIAAAATAAAGGRAGEGVRAPRLGRSREHGCCRPPTRPPRASTLPARPGRRRCEGRPGGPTEVCLEPLARACEPRALLARRDRSRRPRARGTPVGSLGARTFGCQGPRATEEGHPLAGYLVPLHMSQAWGTNSELRSCPNHGVPRPGTRGGVAVSGTGQWGEFPCGPVEMRRSKARCCPWLGPSLSGLKPRAGGLRGSLLFAPTEVPPQPSSP
nr:uncharacterized protein LOC111775136 [Equus caballus]